MNSWKRGNRSVTLWEVDIYPAEGQADAIAQSLAREIADLGIGADLDLA